MEQNCRFEMFIIKVYKSPLFVQCLSTYTHPRAKTENGPVDRLKFPQNVQSYKPFVLNI